MEKRTPAAPARHQGGEGCLTTAVRLPVRIVVLLVVVPVRMVWDLLAAAAKGLHRTLLRPLGRGLEWLYGAVLAPAGRASARFARALVRYLAVVPCSWLYRWALTPLGHGLLRLAQVLLTALGMVLGTLAAGVVWVVGTLVVPALAWLFRTLVVPLGRGAGWLLRAVLVWPWTALYRWVLTPLGHGLLQLYARVLAPAGRGAWTALVWLVRALAVVPATAVYRWVLAPVGRALVVLGRETAAAFGVAWRVAGYVSRAVGRGLKWLARNLVGRPAAWFYRSVCTPVGHLVRDGLWRPVRKAAAEAGRTARAVLVSARETVRQARRDAWRALVGGPRVTQPVEPVPAPARTLGSTTTAPGAAPAPEISLRKRG